MHCSTPSEFDKKEMLLSPLVSDTHEMLLADLSSVTKSQGLTVTHPNLSVKCEFDEGPNTQYMYIMLLISLCSFLCVSLPTKSKESN